MSYVHIVAEADGDSNQKIVLVAKQSDLGWLEPDEGYGYSRDWYEKNYALYPFILEPIDEKSAALSWGGFDKTQTEVNIMGRRIVPGESIVRRELGESWSYTVKSVRTSGS